MRSSSTFPTRATRSFKRVVTKTKLIVVPAMLVAAMLPRPAHALPLMYLTINDVSVTESDSGAVSAVFTVTLDQKNGNPVTMDYAAVDGTALAGKDYAATSGSLTMRVTKTATISVPVSNDLIDEPNQTFTLRLSNATNAVILDGDGIGTIVDDDLAPVLSMDPVTTLEGDTGTMAATFNMTLSEVSEKPVYVKYRTQEGTASAGTDFIPEETTVSFPSGERSAQPGVHVIGDLLNETDETFAIEIFEASDVYLAQVQAQATILNDDPAPMLDIDDVVVDENDGAATFVVRLSRASGQQVSVNYATSDDTAKSPADYTPKNGTVTFAAGETSKQVNVSVFDDSLDEADEAFKLNLSSASNAVIGDTEGNATILDDDAQPEMSISDATVTEGDDGIGTAVFTVTLSAPSGRTIVADYGVSPGSATAGQDYGAVNGPVVFVEGETSKEVEVPIASDTTDEYDETFTVVLSNPYFADITDGEAIGTIIDNDAAPSVAIADGAADEALGAELLVVTLSAVSGKNISIDYATSDGSALAGSDYVATLGTLQIPAGHSEAAIVVPLTDDAIDENDEALSLALSNPIDVLISDAEATLTIADDDAAPSISIADATVIEGDAGSTPVSVAVTLSEASGKTVSVSHATADGTASSLDYTSASGTISFPPGETLRLIEVSATGDLVDEADESFALNLSSANNASLADGASQVTIIDDDSSPTLVVEDATANESASGLTFNVRLSNPSGLLVTVDYSTANGTAAAGQDYTGTTGSLTFLPGQSLKQVVVPITGDTLDEVNETLSLNVVTASNVTVADGTGTGTIVDDDAAPSVSIQDATVTEGNTGTTPAVFSVTLSAASGKATRVNYVTQNGTATAGSDYESTSGALTFAPGQTSAQITVNVIGDTTGEPDETLTIHLAFPVDLVIARSQATGTIIGDDTGIKVSDVTIIEGPTATETIGATRDAVFTITVSPPSAADVVVTFSSAQFTAKDELGAGLSGNTPDFMRASGSLTFAAGETSKEVVVKVVSDVSYEDDEIFYLEASSATISSIDGSGTGTIIDDDLPLAPSHNPSGCGSDIPSGFYLSTHCTFTHGGAPSGEEHLAVIRGHAAGSPLGSWACSAPCSPVNTVVVRLTGPSSSAFLRCDGIMVCAASAKLVSIPGPWRCEFFAFGQYFQTSLGGWRCDVT